MKIAFHTLGCKVNQYETQALEQLLAARGHTIVPFEGEADAYVINTCSVTAVGDKKSRQAIRQARGRAPEAVVAVCGCYAQTHPAQVEALGVDLVSGTGDRTGFVALLEQTVELRRPLSVLDDPMKRRSFEPLPAGGLEGRTRAMLKVEDGCVNFCSYCIIPYARGRVRSLPLEQAAEQVRALAEQGYREIVLTGIEISSWGQDLPGRPPLIDLMEALCNVLPLDMRLRLGSLEPRTVTEDFCRRSAALPQLCPHFHLSLQSGCDATLARMNRKYDSNRYYQSVQLLQEYFLDPGITTDLIVGFPGETEEEFSQTLDFVEQCAFTAMHIFPYSRRPGTPASDLPEQVPNAVKEDRARRCATLARELERKSLARWVGRTAGVLFEEERDGMWYGHTQRYQQVSVPSRENLHNRLLPVRLRKLTPSGLEGELE